MTAKQSEIDSKPIAPNIATATLGDIMPPARGKGGIKHALRVRIMMALPLAIAEGWPAAKLAKHCNGRAATCNAILKRAAELVERTPAGILFPDLERAAAVLNMVTNQDINELEQLASKREAGQALSNDEKNDLERLFARLASEYRHETKASQRGGKRPKTGSAEKGEAGEKAKSKPGRTGF